MLTLALLALLAAPQDPITYQGRAFVFQADLAAGRAAGWIDEEKDDEAVLEGIETALVARLRGAGLFSEARVLREAEGRFAAVFVGDQAPDIEAMLIGGLSNPGRVELRLEAADADLAGGATLAGERERLAAWRAANPEAPVPSFNSVPPGGAGPDPALRWLSGSPATGGEPVPVLRRVLGPVARSDMQVGLRLQPGGGEQHGLAFRLQEEPAEKLNRRLRAHEGRTLVAVLNDVALHRQPVALPLEYPIPLGGDWSIGEVRALLFAGGIPLEAPLTFVERSTRELTHVKRRPARGDEPFERDGDGGDR